MGAGPLLALALLAAGLGAARADIENRASARALAPGGAEVTAGSGTVTIGLLGVVSAAGDTVPEIVDSAEPARAVVNVLTNDTLDGQSPGAEGLVARPVEPWPEGLTLNSDGTLDVARHAPPGTFEMTYRACEDAHPTNCARARVALTVARSRPLLAGTVFQDADQNGALDGFDPGLAGYRVELIDAAGEAVAVSATGSAGQFAFQGFDAGTYALVVTDTLTGLGVARADAFAVEPGSVLIDRNIAVNPTGVVFDAISGAPVTGAVVRLVDAEGEPLPPACLLPGQQGQMTGASGQYRLSIVFGAAPQCPAGRTTYRIAVAPPGGYEPVAGAGEAALDVGACPGDAIAGGPCHVQPTAVPPPDGLQARHHRVLAIAQGDPAVVFNHVPLMPLFARTGTGLSVSKTADSAAARQGDVVVLTVDIANDGEVTADTLTLVERLPDPLVYAPGTARVDGAAFEPETAGRGLRFGPLELAPGQSATVRFEARVTDAAVSGVVDAVSQLLGGDGRAAARPARVRLRIEGLADPACPEIGGVVFVDANRNAAMDPAERGIADVRLTADGGIVATTGPAGRFVLACEGRPEGAEMALRLDTATLPEGMRLIGPNPVTVPVSPDLPVRVEFGAAPLPVVSIDLAGPAFDPGSAVPSEALRNGILAVAFTAVDGPSVMRLTYHRRGEDMALAQARLGAIEELLAEEWRRRQLPASPVQTRIVGAR